MHTQENVLAESSMMVPETRQRLEAALADLQAYVVSERGGAVGRGCVTDGALESACSCHIWQQQQCITSSCCCSGCIHHQTGQLLCAAACTRQLFSCQLCAFQKQLSQVS